MQGGGRFLSFLLSFFLSFVLSFFSFPDFVFLIHGFCLPLFRDSFLVFSHFSGFCVFLIPISFFVDPFFDPYLFF